MFTGVFTMLKNKICLVTGGSRGIGAAICEELARRGADIAIIYCGSVGKAEEIRQKCLNLGVRAQAYKCDVKNFGECGETVKKIAEELGSPDILVNNAGITRDGLVMSMKEEDFNDVIGVNLGGAFNMIRHCSRGFIRKKSGKIINISSVAGIDGNRGQANYAASKAGIIGLTKSVAKELGSRGICCNAIAPGLIETDMTGGMTENEEVLAHIPLARPGKPEEVAMLAAFLAESDYITGEVIRIDGGMTL